MTHVTINNTVDKARWQRFSATNKDRCEVCGKRAQVSLVITASEMTGERGGTNLFSRKLVFCDAHGQQRAVAALNGMMGSTVYRQGDDQ